MSVKKIITFLFFVVLVTLNADIHFTESFENPNVWYNNTVGNVTFDSGVWNFVSVAQEDPVHSYDGTKACRINDNTAGASIATPAVNTVGTISFYYHKPFVGSGSFVLQKSTDGGITFTDLDTICYSNILAPTFYSYAVNDMNSSVILRILNDDNTAHLTIDCVTITDFDGLIYPEVNINLSSNFGTEEYQSVLTVFAEADANVQGDQTVDVSIFGVNVSGDDYNLSSSTITIPDGTASGSIVFTVLEDSVCEGDETAFITLYNASAGINLSSNITGSIVINDNEINDSTFIVSEDFESNTLGIFSSYNSASNIVWDVNRFDYNYSAVICGVAASEASSDWLISPALDLSVSSNPCIIFDNCMDYIGPDMELKVSTDYDGFSDPEIQGTWTSLPFYKSTGLSDWESSGTIDLSSFMSSPAYIAFHYISTEEQSASWRVDNVQIINSRTGKVVNLELSSENGSEEEQSVITVTANANIAVSGDQTLDVTVSGTDITSNDYQLINSTITIPDGSTSGSVTFEVLDDPEYEDIEIATIEISNPSSGIILGSTTSGTVSITDNDSLSAVVPGLECLSTELHTAYPNPFNPETTIKLSIKDGEKGNLVIFNIKGQVVKTFDGLNEGTHELKWYGKDNNGNKAASGIYFYKLTTQTVSETKKIILMK